MSGGSGTIRSYGANALGDGDFVENLPLTSFKAYGNTDLDGPKLRVVGLDVYDYDGGPTVTPSFSDTPVDTVMKGITDLFNRPGNFFQLGGDGLNPCKFPGLECKKEFFNEHGCTGGVNITKTSRKQG